MTDDWCEVCVAEFEAGIVPASVHHSCPFCGPGDGGKQLGHSGAA